jgi:hypothetical protein
VPGARDAVAAYVERRSLQSREHETGYVVAFRLGGGDAGDADDAPTVTVLLGANDESITVEAAGPSGVARSQWDAALWTLNEWNATVQVPKALLVTSADDARAVAHVVLQAWMPYDDALPVSVIDAFLDTAISGSCLFWQGVAGADEPEPHRASS